MRIGSGGSVGDYRAPLFIAWQVTNRCGGRCLHCCEESGPEAAWAGELSAAEAIRIAREIADAGVVEAAFGGGEPLGVPHIWAVFDVLAASGVALKIETDGQHIDDGVADRLAALRPECVQISVDGANAATHRRLRPGSDFGRAVGAIERLAARGLGPELVFVPTLLNVAEAADMVELASRIGARRLVTGPMMRLGRAAASWSSLALGADAWRACEIAMRAAGAGHPEVELVVYPHDIVEEVRQRLSSPQAMMLLVPDGHVKLLNALPFACADLRRSTLAEAWSAYLRAWRNPQVACFCEGLRDDPGLLQHANEVWSI